MKKNPMKKLNPKQTKQPLKSARIKKAPIQMQTKNTPENRLSDLENTLDLNIQILKTFYQSSKPVQSLLLNEATLIDAIENIKKKYLKKKELFKQLKEKKSRSLIELQIYAEKKRKIEEMKDFYQEKIEENQEGLYSKEEIIKKVQKRLKEVEVYIHKLTLNMFDKKRQKYYQDFYINDFLDINNDLMRQKDLLTKKVKQLKIELQTAIDENKLYKAKSSEEKNKTNDTTDLKTNDTKILNDDKLKKLSEKYENKIELINSKISLLKNYLEKMSDQFHLVNINKRIRRNSKSVNVNIIKEDNNNTTSNNNFYKKVNVLKKNAQRGSGQKRLDTDESFTRGGGKNNDDINSRINSFLDFSMLNNKEDENNISRYKFGSIKISINDISAINVKDISYIDKKD